ncbi:MAG: c-type cytochrome [Planctomycetes bacterium]|nr:c-type cytochrome [Planctomycetota bacterium]
MIRFSCIALAAATVLTIPQDAIRTNGKNVAGDNAVPGTLPLDTIKKMIAEKDAHTPITITAPDGLNELGARVPADNPATKAKIELGRQLYFDPRLSKDLTVSCATCHNPTKGYSDAQPTSTGISGQRGGRSAPTVMNRALAPVQFWDGRAASLEAQALGPIGNPIEMGFSPSDAAARIAGIEGYKIQFDKVFGGPPTPDFIAKAIATFERTVLSGASPYDYYQAAEPFRGGPDADESADEKSRRLKILADEKAHPLSEAAARGMKLFFNKAQCNLCHAGENLSDEQYHNLGIGFDKAKPDGGREDFTKKDEDRGKFRTPTLRNIKETAPYMHDGSLKSLKEVVEHYNKGGIDNKWLSRDKIRKLELTETEIADVVAFLEQGLQGIVTKVDVPKLP